MRRLEPREISEQFNAHRAQFEASHEKSGALKAIEAISLAISDIRDAGHDVSLTLSGMPSEQAFDLFESAGGRLIVPFSGTLRIGTAEQLIALATTVSGKPALMLATSEFDIRFNGPDATLKEGVVNGTVRHLSYDLKNDEEALRKFQREVLRDCARNEVVNAHDTADAFDNGPRLRRSARLPKMPPHTP